jgi:hypothetical protein
MFDTMLFLIKNPKSLTFNYKNYMIAFSSKINLQKCEIKDLDENIEP